MTSKGEFPLNYKRTIKHVKFKDTKRKISALKKLKILDKIKSFADFNK